MSTTILLAVMVMMFSHFLIHANGGTEFFFVTRYSLMSTVILLIEYVPGTGSAVDFHFILSFFSGTLRLQGPAHLSREPTTNNPGVSYDDLHEMARLF